MKKMPIKSLLAQQIHLRRGVSLAVSHQAGRSPPEIFLYPSFIAHIITNLTSSLIWQLRNPLVT